jgi:hypothetical protein
MAPPIPTTTTRGRRESAPDWVLTNYDVDTSVPPDVETELRRLRVLQSYDILDREWDTAYDRLAQIAARALQTPTALVGVVDLGRYWRVALHNCNSNIHHSNNHHHRDAPRELPRKQAIASHVILQRQGYLVVMNVGKDSRFVDHPAVRNGTFQFYAGVVLRSPEGYPLGVLAVTDTQPRLHGVSHEQLQTLRDLADALVDLMHTRRRPKGDTGPAAITRPTAPASTTTTTPPSNPPSPTNANTITNTNTDTNNSSSWGVQRSARFLRQYLAKLNDDSTLENVLTKDQRELLRSSYDAAAFLHGSLLPPEQRQELVRENRPDQVTSVQIASLVQSVELAMDAFPKTVPVRYQIDDEQIPPFVLLVELKIFRSCIALLTSACERTRQGVVCLRVFVQQRTVTQKELVFECEDTGPDVELEQYDDLFDAPLDHTADVGEEDCIRADPHTGKIRKALRCATVPNSRRGHGVHALADFIGSIEGGDYGFRPRETEDFEPHGTGTGSVFWFSIALHTPPATRHGTDAVVPRRPQPWIISSARGHGSLAK